MFTRRLNYLITSWTDWQVGKGKGAAHASASPLGPETSREAGCPPQDRSNPEEMAELGLEDSWLPGRVGLLCGFEQLP